MSLRSLTSTTRTRITLAGIGATVLALAISGCAQDETVTPGGPETLTYVAYGGSGQDAQIEAFQRPYSAAHPNISFVNTSPADVATVKAQVDAGIVQWDVMATSPAAAQQNCGTLFEHLDLAKLNAADYLPGTLGDCYVANFANATIFGYNADKFPDAASAPSSVADFFNLAKYPGKRGVITNLQNGMLEYALLGDGVAPDKLYPLDVDRALRKLDTIRSQTLFAPNVGALQQAISANQVDMFLMADSRLIALLNDGKHIKLVWDKTLVAANALAIIKGSPHKATAQDFLSTVVGAAQQAKMSELAGVVPVNLAAKPNLSVNGKIVAAYGDGNGGTKIVQDTDWYAKNFNEVSTKVNTWLVS